MVQVKKATNKIHTGDLKVDEQGNYIISSEAEALVAVARAARLTKQVNDMKSGLASFEVPLQALRKALGEYQKTNELAEIVCGEWKSDLIERTGSMWIWDEIPESLDQDHLQSVVPLKKILRKIRDVSKRKAITDRITKTVLIPEAIDDAVKSGLLTAEMIEPAYVEFVQTSYVQIKEVT